MDVSFRGGSFADAAIYITCMHIICQMFRQQNKNFH